MVGIYTPATRAARSLLIHTGNFSVNQVDGGTTPTEYIPTTQTVQAPTAFTVGTSQSFTAFDAALLQASAYDEMIVDVQPVVAYSSLINAASVSTTNSAGTYSQIARAGIPFWILINTQGYSVSQLYASATTAQATALAAMSTIYSDMVKYQMLENFIGFAFLSPDLNVMFTDYSVITRQMQNALVQQCWSYNRAACFITSRPADVLATVGSTILPLPLPPPTANPNSGIPLAAPIFGCNPAQRDKLVMYYPLDMAANQDASIVLSQLSATLVPTNRDPGFTPNLDVAYSAIIDDSMFTADGTGGVTTSGAGLSNIANILAFAAANGITSLGLFNMTGGTLAINFPVPMQFIPTDANVNTTGSVTTWASAGNIFVAYVNTTTSPVTTTVRQFSPAFVETTYSGPAFA